MSLILLWYRIFMPSCLVHEHYMFRYSPVDNNILHLFVKKQITCFTVVVNAIVIYIHRCCRTHTTVIMEEMKPLLLLLSLESKLD